MARNRRKRDPLVLAARSRVGSQDSRVSIDRALGTRGNHSVCLHRRQSPAAGASRAPEFHGPDALLSPRRY